jgi:hypothetical protein
MLSLIVSAKAPKPPQNGINAIHLVFSVFQSMTNRTNAMFQSPSESSFVMNSSYLPDIRRIFSFVTCGLYRVGLMIFHALSKSEYGNPAWRKSLLICLAMALFQTKCAVLLAYMTEMSASRGALVQPNRLDTRPPRLVPITTDLWF